MIKPVSIEIKTLRDAEAIAAREEWQRGLRAERAEDSRAARAFLNVCRSGDSESLRLASQWLNETVDGWRLAMRRIAKLEQVSPEIQDAFIGIWTEHKGLPLCIGDAATTAKALRILLPRDCNGPPIALYRGEHHNPRRRIHGFSWTANIEVARTFAKKNGALDGGIVLEATAPAKAVLLIRENEPVYYEESEYILDPYGLKNVKVIERYPPLTKVSTIAWPS